MVSNKILSLLLFFATTLFGPAVYATDSVQSSEQVQLSETVNQGGKNQDKYFKLNKIASVLTVAMVFVLLLLCSVLYANNRLRRKANELLRKKNIELITEKENAEKANKAKAEFLSTITHELRTPLYAVTGLTQLLLEENPSKSQVEYLDSLKFSGEYLVSLVNNILDFNKLEKGNIYVDNTVFSLNKRMHDVIDALRSRAQERGNQLNLHLDSKVPDTVKGDALKVSQIIINLVGNAIKFTENGVVDVYVNKVEDVVENKVKLFFEVADSGLGISKSKQDNLFNGFNSESLQINTKYGGSGLGLLIVRRLLNLMNSEISVKSELGKGSQFYFELLFETCNESVSTGVELLKPERTYGDVSGAKVLVVEDNRINQLITKKILQKEGVECSIANNGEEAISKVKASNYDLVLMDIHMPGITGLEATKEIRKFNTDIPIVALTAVTLKDNLKEFYEVGMTDVIPKPYKTNEFFEKLEKALKRDYV